MLENYAYLSCAFEHLIKWQITPTSHGIMNVTNGTITKEFFHKIIIQIITMRRKYEWKFNTTGKNKSYFTGTLTFLVINKVHFHLCM